jgi:hypothetical protein
VLIPAANVQHLVLRPGLVDSVRSDQIRIWPLKRVDGGSRSLRADPLGPGTILQDACLRDATSKRARSRRRTLVRVDRGAWIGRRPLRATRAPSPRWCLRATSARSALRLKAGRRRELVVDQSRRLSRCGASSADAALPDDDAPFRFDPRHRLVRAAAAGHARWSRCALPLTDPAARPRARGEGAGSGHYARARPQPRPRRR